MNDLLFLAHRIPYPPDKGEKIRAWHILRHLAARRPVHLGCFIDDPDDWAHVPTLRGLCASVECVGLSRGSARLRALPRLRPALPLSVACFDHPRLHRWVAARLAAGGIGAGFVYCSAMAPYLADAAGLRRVLDMVDIDSEKWRAYAAASRWPARALWAREARTLLAFERRAAATFDHTLLVSQAEARDFLALAPEARGRVGWIDNGVDLDIFAPGAWPDPYPPGGPVFVFTGTMDYRPNIDAVAWFAQSVMPRLRTLLPGARFWVVGSRPAAEVRALAAADIFVTGRVADVRAYLVHAAAAVAPLRIARGIQNKVLEAMAMGRPVVASRQAFQGVRAQPGRDLLLAETPDEFATRLAEIAAGRHAGLGEAGRAAMLAGHAWPSVLAGLDALLDGPAPLARAAA